jgi:hypothetical protein
MVYYNNSLALPLLAVAALLTGELSRLDEFDGWSSPGFQISVVFTGMVGFGLSIASLWCVQVTSPSTYSMVGALNKIPLAVRAHPFPFFFWQTVVHFDEHPHQSFLQVVGVVMFSEPVTAKLASFIGLALAGGVLYSYIKEKEAQEARKACLPVSSVPNKL